MEDRRWRIESRFSILDPLSPILSFCVDPFPRILRVIVVRTRAGDPRNLRNPVFPQKIVRVAVFFGGLAPFGTARGGEPAVPNDRVFFAALSRDREGRKQ